MRSTYLAVRLPSFSLLQRNEKRWRRNCCRNKPPVAAARTRARTGPGRSPRVDGAVSGWPPPLGWRGRRGRFPSRAGCPRTCPGRRPPRRGPGGNKYVALGRRSSSALCPTGAVLRVKGLTLLAAKTFWKKATILSEYWDGCKEGFSVFWWW